jgi:DNA uptake protein ComE-like DNA-binding protein
MTMEAVMGKSLFQVSYTAQGAKSLLEGGAARNRSKEVPMPARVRVNLANEQELLEVPGFGPAQAAAIIRYRSLHGPITGADQLATVLSGFPLDDAQRACADFSPADSTAPEAPGA